MHWRSGLRTVSSPRFDGTVRQTRGELSANCRAGDATPVPIQSSIPGTMRYQASS
jgi:hypothetical protein